MTVNPTRKGSPFRQRLSIVAALALTAAFSCGIDKAAAQNLVQDPGFEASVAGGSNSNPYWTIANPTDGGTEFLNGSGCTDCGQGAQQAHSGNWYVSFGSTSPDEALTTALTQTINTVAGINYIVSFYLANTGGPSNNFNATFDGQTVLSLTQQDAFGYTLFTGTATASSGSSVLSFVGEQDPAFFLLDDVSVEAAPAPVTGSGVGSAMLAIAGIALHRRRKRMQRS